MEQDPYSIKCVGTQNKIFGKIPYLSYMKKVIKLTESDLTRIVQRVIKENEYHTDEYYADEPNNVNLVAHKWFEKTDDSFFTEFIVVYPTKDEFNESLIENYLMNDIDDEDEDMSDLSNDDILDNYWNPESEIYMLEEEFPNFPGEDLWVEFFNDLVKAGW